MLKVLVIEVQDTELKSNKEEFDSPWDRQKPKFTAILKINY